MAKFLITIANEKNIFLTLHQVYYEHHNQYEHKKHNQKLLNVKTFKCENFTSLPFQTSSGSLNSMGTEGPQFIR